MRDAAGLRAGSEVRAARVAAQWGLRAPRAVVGSDTSYRGSGGTNLKELLKEGPFSFSIRIRYI